MTLLDLSGRSALVVGGGLAGMTCALSMAKQGFRVQLLEKDKELGGVARRLHTTIEGLDVQAHLAEIISRVYKNPLIHVSHEATIKDVSGYLGNFTTNVETEGRIKQIKHGATVLAIGAREYQPTEYLYGQNDQVFTHLELGEEIARSNQAVLQAESRILQSHLVVFSIP